MFKMSKATRRVGHKTRPKPRRLLPNMYPKCGKSGSESFHALGAMSVLMKSAALKGGVIK